MKKFLIALLTFCAASCISADDYKTNSERLINAWRKENNISNSVWANATKLQKAEILLLLRQISHIEMRIAKLKE